MSEQDELAAWLRRRIRERRHLAEHTIGLGNAAEWTELSSGVLVTGEPIETDAWHGTWPMGDSTLTRLMEANDPRDTIARCETELAILDYHAAYEIMREGVRFAICAAGDSYSSGAAELGLYPCRTVRLLGRGYRHRPGYLEAWNPSAVSPARMRPLPE